MGRFITLVKSALSASRRSQLLRKEGCRLLHSGRPVIVHKRGSDILHDPWYNKGTAFSMTERDRLGIRGLLPPGVMSVEQQIDRFLHDYRALEGRPLHSLEDPIELQKWRVLNRLHDRNETLYYKILIKNIQEMAPIIYTPTVGLVCQRYSGLFRRPRGMYFSARDKGEFISMAHNWPADKVDMIVVTDGSRILGLGDLGVQGIGIPIGKLDLYVAAAGINPQRVLPIMFDVGTNNSSLINNPLYLGLQEPRVDGEEYIELIDEFMEAVYTRWPNVIVQFEDFQNKWAFRLLQRYRKDYRMFNDDVQGTAAVALAGILNSVRAQGKPLSDIVHTKIVVLGAGSAGLGVVNMIRQAMAMHLGGGEEAVKKATENFWVLDKDGLLTAARDNMDPDAAEFARPSHEALKEGGLKEGASLLEVVKSAKPHVLLGLSGVGRLFTKEVLEAMKHGEISRPAIFPMSNPTKNSECSSEEAFNIIGSQTIFASGSPFPSIQCNDGRVGRANQGNNMYLFPGIGLGTLVSGALIVTDKMLHAATAALAMFVTDEEVAEGLIYPPISSIRQISRNVAAAVARAAAEEGVAEGTRRISARRILEMSNEELHAFVEDHMWSPDYSPLIYDTDVRAFEETRWRAE